MAGEDKQPAALIVEDDDQISFLLKYILEREGYKVHLARDGKQAQDFLGKLPPPSIITLDIMLPYVDGFQLLEAIRKKPDWKAVPVLMLTAKSQEKDAVRALDAGANDFVLKPFKPEELRARIKRLVRTGT